MLDPQLTNVLQRRIGAFAIDFGLVAVLSGLVFRSQFHRFTWTETDLTTGEPIWNAEQFSRLNELASGFNREFDWGDTKYVMDMSGLLLTLAVGFVLSLLMFVLIPANTGWSPGKKLLRLSVLTAEGDKPELITYAIRTAAGVIDLLPAVVPGLLGFLLAKSDRYHRRLGDRAAGTLVIDATLPLRYVSADLEERRSRLRDTSGVDKNEFESMVDLGDRLSADGEQLGPPQAGDLVESAVAGLPDLPQPDAVEAEPPPLDEQDVSPADRAAHFDQDAVAADSPPIGGSSGNDPLSSTQTWEAPVGEPAPVWHPDTSEFDDLTGDQPLPAAVSRPAPGHRSPSAEATRPTPQHRAETVTTAPTATPTAAPTTAPTATPTTAPAPASTAAPAPQDSTPTQREETPAPQSATPDEIPAQQHETTTATSAPEGDPVWNEEWQAWLYWEPNSERWLRHDDESGRWVPIS